MFPFSVFNKSFKSIAFILSTIILWVGCGLPGAKGQASVPGLELITGPVLLKTVDTLCSVKFDGRASGSAGYDLAARYMEGEFRQLSLKPWCGPSLFQEFQVEYNRIGAPLRLDLAKEGKIVKHYVPGKDFVCRGFSGSGTMTLPVVFCGYGISMPWAGYDDYAGVDVTNKIVMAFKQNPGWKINGSDFGNPSPRFKAKTAAEHGASGMLLVSLPNDDPPQKTIGSLMENGGEQDEHFPQLHIDLPVAADFLEGRGWTLKNLQANVDSTRRPLPVALVPEAGLEVHATYEKLKNTENVVAFLEGSDPVLKDEYVVVGAHLDHVGSQAGQVFFPGANDNASGSAAVLQIARAFKKTGIRTKRSVVFVLFACEEHGLDGSYYLAGHLPVPAGKVAAMLNMDCIGHGDSIQVGNGKSAPELWKIASTLDSLYTRRLVRRTWSGGGADATPFHKLGIPCLYFVTTKSYTHLHYMTDVPSTLNLPLYESVVKLAYLTALEVAGGHYQRETIKE